MVHQKGLLSRFTEREIKIRFLGLSAFSQPGDLRSQIWKKNTGVAASGYSGTQTTSLVEFDYPHKPEHGYWVLFLFFLVPWGHTLRSKINRVAGRVLKIPSASVTIDTLIKCPQSFNTIRVKWKKWLSFCPNEQQIASSIEVTQIPVSITSRKHEENLKRQLEAPFNCYLQSVFKHTIDFNPAAIPY